MLRISYSPSSSLVRRGIAFVCSALLLLGILPASAFAATHVTRRAAPATGTPTLYISDTTATLYAIDANVGGLRWRITIPATKQTPQILLSTPFVATGFGNVFVGSNQVPPEHNFYALDAATGVARWSFQATGKVSATPVGLNGHVLFGAEDGSFYSLNATTGNQDWRFVTQPSAVLRSSAAVATINSLPSVYFGTHNDNSVYGLNANTGAQIWRTQLPGATTGAVTKPAIDVEHKLVFVGSSDHHVYALNARTGAIVWDHQAFAAVACAPRFSSVNGSGVLTGLVYTCISEEIDTLNALTGAQVWRDLNFDSDVFTTPAASPVVGSISGRLVYTGDIDEDQFNADNALSGQFVFRGLTLFNSDMRTAFTLANTLLYVPVTSLLSSGSRVGSVYAFNPDTGTGVWRFDGLPGGEFAGPAGTVDDVAARTALDAAPFAVV
jgi:outer membrane protein assembly factor BamB